MRLAPVWLAAAGLQRCRAGPSLVLVQICWTTTFRSVDELDLVGEREVLQCLLTLSPAPGCVEVFLTEAGRLRRTGPFQQRGSLEFSLNVFL